MKEELYIARELVKIESIDRAELLRYLGYKQQTCDAASDAILDARIDALCEHCLECATPRIALRSFACKQPDTSSEPIRLIGSQLELAGHDIAEHLKGAQAIILMVVTIGSSIDQELRRLSFGDALDHLIFDAAATALVERVADAAEARARDWAASQGLFTSWRFSPGYGDLPLETQRLLLDSLDASRKLGITLSDSLLMVPSKSVSAVMGVHPEAQKGMASSCSICSLYEFCTQRLQGRTCRGVSK